MRKRYQNSFALLMAVPTIYASQFIKKPFFGSSLLLGSCSPARRAGHLSIRRLLVRPSCSGLHVEVLLGKILNPKLFPMAVPLVCECVLLLLLQLLTSRLALGRNAALLLLCGWVNAVLCCKSALSNLKTRKVL